MDKIIEIVLWKLILGGFILIWMSFIVGFIIAAVLAASGRASRMEDEWVRQILWGDPNAQKPQGILSGEDLTDCDPLEHEKEKHEQN